MYIFCMLQYQNVMETTNTYGVVFYFISVPTISGVKPQSKNIFFFFYPVCYRKLVDTVVQTAEAKRVSL